MLGRKVAYSSYFVICVYPQDSSYVVHRRHTIPEVMRVMEWEKMKWS
jgi:hypothetical protein